METAISSVLPAALAGLLDGHTTPAAPAAAPADWRDEWFVFMVPDISDETAAEITKAGAWPAYSGFFRLLWKRQREAEKAKNEKALAACRAGVLLGEGVKGLARSIGSCPKAMNRQLAELHRLGILAVAKPPASFTRDKAGRIIRRPAHKGLVPASKIRFNAGEEHKRPKNRQGSNRPLRVVGQGGSQGSDRPLKGGRSKGRSGTTPISPIPISPSAGGHAVGNGRPAEEPGTRPAAGEAPQLRPFTGSTKDAWEATRSRLDAEKAARDAKDAEDAARREAETSTPQPPAQDATEAARNLTAAVADLSPASRKKARREARKMTREERQAAAEAQALVDLIEKKRRQERDGTAAEAAEFKDKAKKASRKERQARREIVPVGAT